MARSAVSQTREASGNKKGLLFFFHELQQFTRLTLQFATDRLEGTETHRFRLVGFQDGKVGEREVHSFREFRQADAPLRHDSFEIQSDRHGSNGQIVFGFKRKPLTKRLGQHQDQTSRKQAARIRDKVLR